MGNMPFWGKLYMKFSGFFAVPLILVHIHIISHVFSQMLLPLLFKLCFVTWICCWMLGKGSKKNHLPNDGFSWWWIPWCKIKENHQKTKTELSGRWNKKTPKILGCPGQGLLGSMVIISHTFKEQDDSFEINGDKQKLYWPFANKKTYSTQYIPFISRL